ncbi:Intramolecular chaperone auto-processing domain containing protein [uncultured Caudovirales phage]|uniref:Intramolecular chaperone auto-processing domain containing protein n=1 Tax=uncultured Caudovirales phage TaxID=2100421 RepID=A0A6J5S6V3_9CAUD|nr:Intramolecular chaperone auto-processing domain containing protein [uncultured Caudovirales phage]
MQRAIIIVLLFLSFGLKAQVYQAMPQAGYGPVKRFLTDSVLTIPTGINSLRNISGGRDAGQIRWNTTDSGFYVYSGYQWIKINIDSVSLSNRINGKLNISDTASMLSAYLRKGDTLSLSNRINLRVKYSDTASMLLPYLRKLDTASLSDRINKKMDSLILTTIGTGGLATLLGTTLNIPNYGGALTGYVPYSGATNNVTLGSYNLTGTLLNADYALQVKNGGGSFGNATLNYTAITSQNGSFNFFTNWMSGATTFSKGAAFVYPTSGTTFQYLLPIRNGTLALVEDTVSLSNRINAKIGASDTVSLSNRINLKVNISDTASMLLPYLRKADTSSLSNRINLKLNAADTVSLSNRINLKLNISDTASMLSSYQSAINARVKYSDTAAMLDSYLTAAVKSVGLSMPVAFSVANSPITSTGTLAVSAIGTAAQYIRGDGQLATLPTGSGGGSSVNYYLNGGTSQGTIGGSTYYEMSRTAVIGTNVDFSRTNAQGNGLISQFITDANDPNRTEIPAGAWNFELFFNASSSGGSPSYYVELLKYDGTTFTSIASGSANPELITSGTTIDLYLTSLAVPYTTLAITDRLVVRVYVVTSGKTITLHTQNGHLCLITTTFSGGVTSLNGLTANTQYLAVGTAGTDFAINSLTDTHTFNLPTASATNRGALSSADWTTFNGKMNYTDTVSLSNRINTKLNSSDTVSLSNRINTKANALSGTTNTVPKFTSSTIIGNSNIKDDGNIVTINATAGSFGALQVGNYNGNILLNTNNTSAGLIFQNTSASNKKWDFSSFNNDLSFNESNVNPVMTLQAGGNVGINVTNPSNKLEVNGTFKSVGIATFGSTLSNGTYGYTLPSATGTLALTSQLTSGTVTSIATGLGLSGGTITTSGTLLVDTSSTSILSRQRAANTYATTSSLSGYLPLIGGTLTGALGGTSALFSSSVTASGLVAKGTGSFNVNNNIRFQRGTGVEMGYIGWSDESLNNSTWLFKSSNGNPIAFSADGISQQMFIGLTGNVLIGTTTDAGYKLDVNGTGRFSGSVGINTNPGINKFAIQVNNSSSNQSGIDITNGVNASFNVSLRTDITEINAGGTGNMCFSNGLERMRITSSGNVGIGTTSPSDVLEVNGAGNLGVTISAPTDISPRLLFKTVSVDRAKIVGSTDGLLLSTLSTTPIIFNTNSVERMRITSGGNVLIGIAADNGRKLQVNGTIYANNNIIADAASFQLNIPSGGNYQMYVPGSNNFTFYNSNVGNISNINYTTGAYTATSDINKKKDFELSNIGLNEVLGLKPTLYRMKSEDKTSDKHLGFIAQEVKEFIPQAYSESGEGEDKFIGLTEMPIVAALTKAVQELSAQIKELQTKIQTLENK